MLYGVHLIYNTVDAIWTDQYVGAYCADGYIGIMRIPPNL